MVGAAFVAGLAKGLKSEGGPELAMPFEERNVNFGKPYSDVEVGLGRGALPAALVDGS